MKRQPTKNKATFKLSSDENMTMKNKNPACGPGCTNHTCLFQIFNG